MFDKYERLRKRIHKLEEQLRQQSDPTVFSIPVCDEDGKQWTRQRRHAYFPDDASLTLPEYKEITSNEFKAMIEEVLDVKFQHIRPREYNGAFDENT